MTFCIRRFLSKLFIAIVYAALSLSAFAGTNVPSGDIGDYGSWATENNMTAFKESLSNDLNQFSVDFQQKQLVSDYVPIEARVGIAMMNGLTHVAKILDTSLVRFMVIFMIIMYLFWTVFEAYNFMSTGGGDVKKFIMEVGKKMMWLIIWIMVLEFGPAKLFLLIMGPVISLGTILSDIVLNAVSAVSGAVLPDTCNAIREYAAENTPSDMLINATAAADIMCVPSRLSGFFTTAIVVGWKWMISSVGHSIIGFTVGAIFVVIFVWNTWRFALMALGVIMDLFLCVLLLPFTALAETITPTSYKGLAGNIFNEFLKLFNVESVKLNTQINRFVNATIYFVALSLVIAICAGLLYGIIGNDLVSNVPSLQDDGFIPTLLTGALVGYLAKKANDIAQDIGGGAKVDSSFGTKFGEDIKTLATDTYKSVKEWAKIIAEEKKK